MRIFLNSWFIRFARREEISTSSLLDAAQRADKGQIDADLGGGVIKQRIARPGEGKSKGYRSIVLIRRGEICFFVFGFPKSALGNIRADELDQFKKMAKHVLNLSAGQLTTLIAEGLFQELSSDKEIS